MKDWNEIANMRTTLLHLQFIYAGVSSQINEQIINMNKQYKDRILQLNELSEECSLLKTSNFRKILIVKLE